MSTKTKNLPIYKSSYQLVKLLTDVTRQFSRALRPTLGAHIMREAVDLVLCVYRANAALDKSDHIRGTLERIQVLEMLVQMAFDLRVICPDAYASCIELTENIEKQAGGWLKYANGRTMARQSTAVRRPDSRYVKA